MSDTAKITASHRERLCLVYVRQSTLAQTRANTESLERQYDHRRQRLRRGCLPAVVELLTLDPYSGHLDLPPSRSPP